MITPYPKCRTCKHYEPALEGEENGVCIVARPAFENGMEKEADLGVSADFSCWLHTPLEGGKEDWKPFHQHVIENPDAYKGCGQF